MNAITEHAFDAALACHGLPKPPTKSASDESRSALSQASFKVARRILDMLRIVCSQRTLQPEHVHNLARLSELISYPLSVSSAAANRRSASSARRGAPLGAMRGGSGSEGHTVLPGGYFNPEVVGSYSADNDGSHTRSFPDVPGGDGYVRYTLDASPVFPVDPSMRGGSGSGSGSGSRSGWMTEDAMACLIREYKARAGAPDLRVGEGAKALLRRLLESNLDGILSAAATRKSSSSSSKKTNCPTGTAITKAADGWVVRFK